MAVYKEEKTNTWRVLYRYTDWNGERKQSQKRGFKTKREAQAWEREQLNKLGGDLDMTFKSFVQHYTEDIQTRIKENTWATKEHIIQTKLMPYFGKLKMCNITAWGYELLKHDYTTFDLFGAFGYDLNATVTLQHNWSFYDNTKTSAEIVLDLYRLIREETQEMVIIGCNTITHLCAGFVEVNRIGDDTSGKVWTRTRAMGVNSLAFRLPQNGRFYMIDADCVGILEHNIPWELNRQWLDLLARSGSPLFVSCQKGILSEKQENEVKKAFSISSVQKNKAIPQDWEYNTIPQKWIIDGELTEYDWFLQSYPTLMERKILPYQ